MARFAVVLLLALLVATPLAAAAEGDPAYRATGQMILYLVLIGIVVGLVGAWWVAKRYEP